MKIAYLILVHNNPQHLQRLVKSLSSPSSACFIHIDRKSNLDDFANLQGENIHISQERIPVYWGDFSQVQAILTLLQLALAEVHRFDYFVLLSGTDYPLQSTAYIESFFQRHSGKEFINLVSVPCEAVNKTIARFTTYKFPPNTARMTRTLRKLLVKAGVTAANRDYKRYLRDLTPYAGSTWWALSREACEYIQHFVSHEPKIINFFKYTECPDESFFQTILGNSPFKARMQRNLTYVDWSKGGANPSPITEAHVEFLTATPSIVLESAYGVGELLFARKFSDETGALVQRLDQRLGDNRQLI